MTEHDPSKIDQLLDLLLDALQERQAVRPLEQSGSQIPPTQESAVDEAPEPIPAHLPAAKEDEPADDGRQNGSEMGPGMGEGEEDVHDAPYAREKLPPIHLDRMLGRLVIFLLVVIVLVNIPFNRYGTNLARAMPDEQALVIRDGLVLKGDGEEIYVLEDNHKRWISSMDAFDYYGFRWEQVNLVDDDFLDQFPPGPALSILKKCASSPHIFAIENDVKRWIKDIPTFEAQGYVWEDVQIVSCAALESIPPGTPIPPDAGEPPAP